MAFAESDHKFVLSIYIVLIGMGTRVEDVWIWRQEYLKFRKFPVSLKKSGRDDQKHSRLHQIHNSQLQRPEGLPPITYLLPKL